MGRVTSSPLIHHRSSYCNLLQDQPRCKSPGRWLQNPCQDLCVIVDRDLAPESSEAAQLQLVCGACTSVEMPIGAVLCRVRTSPHRLKANRQMKCLSSRDHATGSSGSGRPWLLSAPLCVSIPQPGGVTHGALLSELECEPWQRSSSESELTGAAKGLHPKGPLK